MDSVKDGIRNFVAALTRIYFLYKPFHKAFVFVLLLAISMQLCSLAGPFFLGKLIDGITKGANLSTLIWLAAGILLFEILEIPCGHLTARTKTLYVDNDVPRHLSIFTLEKISGLSTGQISSEHSGYKQSVVEKGESAIKQMVDMILDEFIPAIAKSTVTIIALCILNPPIALFVACTAFAYIALSIRLNMKFGADLKILRRMENESNKEYADIVRNLALVQLNAQEKRVIKEHDARLKEQNDFSKNSIMNYVNKITIFREPLARIGLAAVIIMSLFMIRTGAYTAGQLAVSISWSLMLFSTINRIGPIQRRCMMSYASINRYFQLIDTPTTVPLAKNPTRPKGIQGRIEFRNVTFSYPQSSEESRRTVRNISFIIEPGEICAMVGPSGAGKSTLIGLLQRVYDPQEGEILIDGIDLRLLDLKFYRRNVGYVEQQVKLWDRSVRYNILFGLNGEGDNFPESELEKIAETTCIDRFYPRLGSKRFDTIIGENGVQLSGGERQRVGIARALVKNPRILIFDEATNSLDNENDALIQVAMKKALVGRTGIIIAHRLSTVRHANKILVCDDGKIADCGTHTSLMRSSTLYYSLVTKEAVPVL